MSGALRIEEDRVERKVREALREVGTDCENRARYKFNGLDGLDTSVSTAAKVVHAREFGEGEAFATAAHLLNDAIEKAHARATGGGAMSDDLFRINRLGFRVPSQAITGAQLRRLPMPPISDGEDIYAESMYGLDAPIGLADYLVIRPGDAFYSVPKIITPGSKEEA